MLEPRLNESERLEELEERVAFVESRAGGLYDCLRGLALEVIDPSLVWDGEHWSSRTLGHRPAGRRARAAETVDGRADR